MKGKESIWKSVATGLNGIEIDLPPNGWGCRGMELKNYQLKLEDFEEKTIKLSKDLQKEFIKSNIPPANI